MILFNNAALSILNKNLDGLWAREKVISENLANYETPGYKRKYVTFEDELLSKIQQNKSTSSEYAESIMSVEPQEVTSNADSLRNDGNNVDIELENLEMARTQINYSYTVKTLNEYFSRLRTSINGG